MTQTMTPTMATTLAQIVTGNTSRPMIASHWDRDAINELESLGYITIREYDGELRATNTGEIALRQVS